MQVVEITQRVIGENQQACADLQALCEAGTKLVANLPRQQKKYVKNSCPTFEKDINKCRRKLDQPGLHHTGLWYVKDLLLINTVIIIINI